MSELPIWEPPYDGSEAEHLAGALDRLRHTFRWKVDGLDAAGLAARLPSSSLSLGGLLKHLAANEDYAFRTKIDGREANTEPPWADNGWDQSDDWEFESAAQDSPETLYALWDGAVARSRTRLTELLAAAGLDQAVALGERVGHRVSLRRVLFDLVEEYGRHTGHADLLREALDGRTGEDPPAQWRPPSSG
jgi:hypothetical protein